MARNLIPIQLDKNTGELVAKESAPSSGAGTPGYCIGYLHEQTVVSSVWTIVHNQGTKNIVAQIYDTTGNLIIPDIVNTVDINTIQIDFGTGIIGKAHIILFPNPIN